MCSRDGGTTEMQLLGQRREIAQLPKLHVLLPNRPVPTPADECSLTGVAVGPIPPSSNTRTLDTKG